MNQDEIERLIAQGEAMARADRGDEAIAFFHQMVERYPDEPRASFALAGAFDYLGREEDAVGPYRRAKELG